MMAEKNRAGVKTACFKAIVRRPWTFCGESASTTTGPGSRPTRRSTSAVSTSPRRRWGRRSTTASPPSGPSWGWTSTFPGSTGTPGGSTAAVPTRTTCGSLCGRSGTRGPTGRSSGSRWLRRGGATAWAAGTPRPPPWPPSPAGGLFPPGPGLRPPQGRARPPAGPLVQQEKPVHRLRPPLRRPGVFS